MTPQPQSADPASPGVEIRIAEQFSAFPGGRYKADGQYSGEIFRERYLVSHLEKGERINIVLKGTAGYGSSFLEEAFGGLIRNHDFDEATLRQRLAFDRSDSSYNRYIDAIWKYIHLAQIAKSRK